jgi:CheY-like chemotaxis protein
MNKTILIIEDNPDNFYLMKFLLERNGYIIEWAETGAQGIEKAKLLVPLAILLDIQLPEMDGYAVARELTKQADLKNIPIIAVTSYAMVGDKEKALSAGAFAYMEKPINPETFVSEIKSHIEAKYASTKG